MALGIVYAVLHHAGTIFAGLGEVGSTRWADWIDLATPYAVTGAAGGALRAGAAGGRCWTGFWLAAVLYTQGHGIHLAANSVGNDLPGEDPGVVHLWDEILGHYLWHAGFALLVAVLAVALATRPPVGGPPAHLVAALVGLTHLTNSIEGRTPWLGIATATVFVVWGLRTRAGMGRYLVSSYALSLVLFAVFGVWQGGFPEFSELGWI